MNRPRPVLVFGIVMAVLTAVSESADAADVLPDQVFPWVRLAILVTSAVGGAVWAQSQVTPVSDPRTNAGVPLVPDPRGRPVAGPGGPVV